MPENIDRLLGNHDAKLEHIEVIISSHGEKLDKVSDDIGFVKNSTAHITQHLGELRQMLKETQVEHELRITNIEKDNLVVASQHLNERLTALENKVARAFWYGLATLTTAASSLGIGLTVYWHKLTGLFHGN